MEEDEWFKKLINLRRIPIAPDDSSKLIAGGILATTYITNTIDRTIPDYNGKLHFPYFTDPIKLNVYILQSTNHDTTAGWGSLVIPRGS